MFFFVFIFLLFSFFVSFFFLGSMLRCPPPLNERFDSHFPRIFFKACTEREARKQAELLSGGKPSTAGQGLVAKKDGVDLLVRGLGSWLWYIFHFLFSMHALPIFQTFQLPSLRWLTFNRGYKTDDL